MKLKRIGILVAAMTVFAVMASGMAFAATDTYAGTLQTTYYAGTGVQLNSQSSGSFSGVTTSDNLQWNNKFISTQTHQVYGYVDYMVWTQSSPHARVPGLTSAYGFSCTVPASGSISPTSGGHPESSTLGIGGCFFQTYHQYDDSGFSYYSLDDTGMSYS
jgi:hypothetical protein